MKTIKHCIFLCLVLCLVGCSSAPDLDGFRTVEISNNMLDTISVGRLGGFKKTIEKTYLFGYFVLKTAGSTLGYSPVDLEGWKEELDMPDTIKPMYKEELRDLVFYPKVTYEVESKYIGIYQQRKTIIKGVKLRMITKEENEYIKTR